MPNITTAIFGSGDNVARALPNLWQWDRGAKLVIEGLDLPTSYAVHFSNSPSGYDENEGSQLGDASGVTIPDEMLQAGLPIYAWIWLATTTSAATAAQVVIQINQRVMPPDYHPSTSQETIIDEAIAALNAAVDGLEYLSVEAETLEPGEPATVTKIHNENSGEVTLVFGIPQGDQGETGPQGPQGVQGETGPQGPQGVQGETGPAATDAQVEAAVNTWLGNNVAQETGYVLDSTLTMSNAAAPADKVGDLKSAVRAATGNEQIVYNYPNKFFYTQGTTWNPAAPSSDNSWDAAVVDCAAGDVFTVSGLGGFSPKIWAFADSSNNILSRKDDSTTAITNELIVAPQNASKLILNNKKSTYPNAKSYYGKLLVSQVEENTGNIELKSGDVRHIVESLPSNSLIGQYWNFYFDVSPQDGDICLIRVNSYSGTKLTNINVRTLDSNNVETFQLTELKMGKTSPILLNSSVKKVWVQLKRSETENNVTANMDFVCNNSGGLGELSILNFHPVFTVEKDGSGDFESLVQAVNYATRFMDATVYVGEGTWDVLDEFGDTYIQSVSSSQRGLYLKNRIHLIFSSNAVVTAMYDGVGGVIKDSTVEWFSIFNAGEYGFTLENCNIVSRNIRYPIHDERSQTTEEAYKNHYINCNIQHSNQKYDQSQTKSGYAQCIGGGLGKDGHIIIEGCIFENPYQYSADAQGRKVLVSYHVNNKSGATGRSMVEIKGCYFKGTGTAKAGYYGTNTDVSTMLVHDNSMGKEPFVAAESAQSTTENIEMLAWNNVIREA